uniref:Wsv137-like protein n=1 Tax=Melicertus latisulcatus majanivirus TaxID=2984277 RepID=A0A9C7BZ85_9VIRU|nr:MAG: wsv137-like protein [Melicertus latisulcatus majanivirus]
MDLSPPNYYIENLSHLKIGIIDFFNFIISDAGSTTLRDIIMIGTHNTSSNKKILWTFIKSLSLINIGITVLDDNNGTIHAIEIKKIKYSSDIPVKEVRTNEKYIIIQRIFQAMVIVFQLLSHNKEWQPVSRPPHKDINHFNDVYLSEPLGIENVDVICSMLINDMKEKKKVTGRPTRIWFSLENIYKESNNNDNDSSLNLFTDTALTINESTMLEKNISQYEYDKDDIAAINVFFSLSPSHKVKCCNPVHSDQHPSMHLYRRANVWLSRIEKYNPTKDELQDLEMKEYNANESNISTFRGSNIILFTVSAHCFACQYHVYFLPKSDLKKILSAFYIIA